MKMTILLTLNGYNNLARKLDSLYKNDLMEAVKMVEETRPIGVSDEFPPEYMTALDMQNRVEKKILDIQTILNDCEIFNPSQICYDKNHKKKIGFGTKVKLLNCETNKEVTYTLVSIYESDINNGYMSVSAPFALEMNGLVEGDSFEFNDIEYEVLDVNCAA